MTPKEPAGAGDRRRGVSLPPADGRIESALFTIFLAGVVVFSPLMVGLFDKGPAVTVLGIPILYAYLFVTWAVLIGLIALAAGRLHDDDVGDGDGR